MKEKIISILVMTLLITTAINAVGTTNEIKNIKSPFVSSSEVEWNLTIDRGEFDSIRHVEQTSDGGYICCGLTEESDNFYIHLIKVDSDGNMDWNVVNYDLNGTRFNTQENDIFATYVIQTGDGGYLVGGWSVISEEYQGQVIWAAAGFFWKTDSAGTTEWFKHYYDVESLTLDFIYCILEIADRYMASGFRYYYDETGQLLDEDGLLMKTDSLGNPEWTEVYNAGDNFDVLCSLYPTSGRDGYLMSGCTYSVDDDGSLWMVSTGSDGFEMWNEVYDGPGLEYSYVRDCFETSDGGGIICGNTNSYGAGMVDVWVIKTDSSGIMDWNKTIGDTHQDHTWDMCKTNDGCYVVAICKNWQYAGGTKEDIWLVKITEDGYTVWSYLIEKEDIQIPTGVRQTSDGGFIVSGRTRQFGHVDSDGILYKISAIENQRPDKPDTPSGPTMGSPGIEYTYTTSSIDPDGDDITYGWDWDDGSDIEWFDTGEASHSWAKKDKYLVRVMAKDEYGGESDWSDPLEVLIPRDKAISNPFINFLQSHPNWFPLLQKLIQQLGFGQ